jgi:leucyl aminopeptidase (aminopeptidase T)
MAQTVMSEVARVVLDTTLKVKKGETVTVETWKSGLEFALEVVKQSRRIGAIPLLIYEDEGCYLDGARNAPKDVWGLLGKHEYNLIAASDVYVFIPGPPLGVYYKRMTREQFAESTKYNSSWYKAANKAKLRGARLSFGYVGEDLAGFLGKSVKEVVDGQLQAALTDLKKVMQTGKAIGAKLQDGKEVVVQTGSSKFEFVLRGESELEDGIVDSDDIAAGQNMAYVPPGYVLKDVAKRSASGTVRLSPSLTRLGVIEDAVLEFSKGKLVSWSSKGSKELIDEVVAGVKEEERTLPYVSIGLNPRMKYGLGQDRFVKGALCIYGFGFTGVCRNASATVEGVPLLERGRISL